MTKNWEKYRAQIFELYKAQNLPLHQVRDIMEREHGFKASIRAFRTRFGRWGVTKYNCQSRRNSMSTGWSARSAASPQRSIMTAPLSPRHNQMFSVFPSSCQEDAEGEIMGRFSGGESQESAFCLPITSVQGHYPLSPSESNQSNSPRTHPITTVAQPYFGYKYTPVFQYQPDPSHQRGNEYQDRVFNELGLKAENTAGSGR